MVGINCAYTHGRYGRNWLKSYQVTSNAKYSCDEKQTYKHTSLCRSIRSSHGQTWRIKCSNNWYFSFWHLITLWKNWIANICMKLFADSFHLTKRMYHLFWTTDQFDKMRYKRFLSLHILALYHMSSWSVGKFMTKWTQQLSFLNHPVIMNKGKDQ